MVEQGNGASVPVGSPSGGDSTVQARPTTRFGVTHEMARRLRDAYPADPERIARVKDNLLRLPANNPQPGPENGHGNRP